MLCGDLTANQDGVIRYLRCGEIDASDEDWVRGSLFRWGGTSSRDAAKDIYYILDDGRGYAVDANVKVTNALELQRLNERSIAMSLCARTLEKDWGATCKCDEVTESTSPIVDVKKHVKAGCTFKNCHKVAAFTLRRESALEPGLTMTDDDLAAARRAPNGCRPGSRSSRTTSRPCAPPKPTPAAASRKPRHGWPRPARSSPTSSRCPGAPWALDEENRQLNETVETLRSELDVLKADNQRLQDKLQSSAFLDGALAVLLGVIITLVVPRLWPRRRSSSSWA